MRELSNSFLSEIDTAARELPGSTPVRRLMMQRVLERSDHIAANSVGDRLTQLYLASAYIRFGSLQGNPYEQNIGDAPGALVSLNKALAIAQELRSSYPNDHGVMDVLASGLKTKSCILFGDGRPHEAIASINQAIDIFKKEVESSTATVDQLADTAETYHILGDELGEPEVALYPLKVGGGSQTLGCAGAR